MITGKDLKAFDEAVQCLCNYSKVLGSVFMQPSYRGSKVGRKYVHLDLKTCGRGMVKYNIKGKYLIFDDKPSYPIEKKQLPEV